MNSLSEIVSYVLGFKPYVLLPIIIFIFSMVFRIPIQRAIKSCLTIGIGFIGIFVIFGFFVESIGPAVKALVSKMGLNFSVLDVGWTPLAAITWSYKLAPLLLVLIILVNTAMLLLKLTKTVNIDIWNYWHFIFTGAIIYETTGSILLSVAAALFTSILIIKLGDWSAEKVNKFGGLEGVSITTLSAGGYYPLGVLGDRLIEKIPLINKMNAKPEAIKEKLGVAGEPMTLGFIMGILLGLGAGYDAKGVLQLAFEIAAVIYILPLMSGTLSKGLIPISDGLKEFMKKRFPQMGDTYIGLDVAVIVGNASVIVTALLLMPVALVLAFLLPGVKFIPLGDLANIMGSIALVVVAVRGNVIRALIISIPILIGKLYVSSYMAHTYTTLAQKANFKFEGYDGLITSFLDGGNVTRYWIIRVFEGNTMALLATPVIAYLLYITWRSISK
ncbi:MAG: PTS galactitol transporter subunit IIC [Clostridia bacterium]|nr:PTS galactitol transporter subunit IIC [Clostridia bacterium]